MELDWSNESLEDLKPLKLVKNDANLKKNLNEEQMNDLEDLLADELEPATPVKSSNNLFKLGEDNAAPFHALKQLSRISSPKEADDTKAPLTMSKLSPVRFEKNGPMKIDEIVGTKQAENKENAFDQIKSFLEVSQKNLERNIEKLKAVEKKKSKVNEVEIMEKLKGSYSKVEELKKDVDNIEISLKEEIEREKKLSKAIEEESEVVAQLEEKLAINETSGSFFRRLFFGIMLISFLLALDFGLQLFLAYHNVKFVSLTQLVKSDFTPSFFRKAIENVFSGTWNKMVPS